MNINQDKQDSVKQILISYWVLFYSYSQMAFATFFIGFFSPLFLSCSSLLPSLLDPGSIFSTSPSGQAKRFHYFLASVLEPCTIFSHPVLKLQLDRVSNLYRALERDSFLSFLKVTESYILTADSQNHRDEILFIVKVKCLE